MYLTIHNTNIHTIRVRVTDKILLTIIAKTSVSTGVDRKYYERLKLDPRVHLDHAVSYETFHRTLKRNEFLEAEVTRLQKELATLRASGVLLPKSISELMNLALEKIDDKGKLAMFKALIEENLKIRST